ncbi:MAG: hypothetical protein ACK5QT_07250 [Oligoflexia bacterium]
MHSKPDPLTYLKRVRGVREDARAGTAREVIKIIDLDIDHFFDWHKANAEAQSNRLEASVRAGLKSEVCRSQLWLIAVLHEGLIGPLNHCINKTDSEKSMWSMPRSMQQSDGVWWSGVRARA